MTKIIMDLADEYADPDHPMGVTEEGHLELCDALAPFGHEIEVAKAPDAASAETWSTG